MSGIKTIFVTLIIFSTTCFAQGVSKEILKGAQLVEQNPGFIFLMRIDNGSCDGPGAPCILTHGKRVSVHQVAATDGRACVVATGQLVKLKKLVDNKMANKMAIVTILSSVTEGTCGDRGDIYVSAKRLRVEPGSLPVP